MCFVKKVQKELSQVHTTIISRRELTLVKHVVWLFFPLIQSSIQEQGGPAFMHPLIKRMSWKKRTHGWEWHGLRSFVTVVEDFLAMFLMIVTRQQAFAITILLCHYILY